MLYKDHPRAAHHGSDSDLDEEGLKTLSNRPLILVSAFSNDLPSLTTYLGILIISSDHDHVALLHPLPEAGGPEAVDPGPHEWKGVWGKWVGSWFYEWQHGWPNGCERVCCLKRSVVERLTS